MNSSAPAALITCPACDGTGEHGYVDERSGAWVLDRHQPWCSECRGLGTVEEEVRGLDVAVADTEPAPPMGDQDDAASLVVGLEASLALIEDARVAKVPPASALRIGRDAIARVGGRR
jgi:hypothetical protein